MRNEGPEIPKKCPRLGEPPVAADAKAGCVIPEEIMVCILTRLPVKSIIRSKSVCKLWRDLLSSPEFIKLHQGQFSSDPDNQSVITQNLREENCRAMSIFKINSDENKPTFLEYPHPETYLMDIVGCCNGLICLGRPWLELKNIVLWNPATKLFKFVSLPENVDFTDPKTVTLGFGYDSEGDDFKVVVIFGLGEDFERIGAVVYSVNSDFWITVDPNFHFDEYQSESCFNIVNGNPYWQATFNNLNLSAKNCGIGDAIVWFDVRKMDFKAVPVVTSNFHCYEMGSAMVDWKGSLGVLVCNRNEERVVKSIDVWVYDDGEQIWRKDHTFGPIEVNFGWIFKRLENGKLFCVNRKLCVYDLATGWIKVYDTELPYETDGYLYTESLKCIQGMRPLR